MRIDINQLYCLPNSDRVYVSPSTVNETGSSLYTGRGLLCITHQSLRIVLGFRTSRHFSGPVLWNQLFTTQFNQIQCAYVVQVRIWTVHLKKKQWVLRTTFFHFFFNNNFCIMFKQRTCFVTMDISRSSLYPSSSEKRIILTLISAFIFSTLFSIHWLC